MKWIPAWLAKTYSLIYAQRGTESFEFSEAATILGLRDERKLADRLVRLRLSGYLTVKRDSADPRRKLFRLIGPESVTIALAIQSKGDKSDVPGKLIAASGLLDYYVEGAYAAYRYHRYSAPSSIDISVKAEQLATWISLLSERDVAISIDEAPAERPAAVNVHLHSDFDEKLAENTGTIDGIRYLAPESLVALALAREGEGPSIEDVLAILVVRRKELGWSKLLALCDSYNACRQLGCMLEVLNFEAETTLFPRSFIDKVCRRSKLEARLDFPGRLKAQPQEQRYSEICSKWNIRLHVGRAVFSKIVTDLVRR